MAAMQPSIPRVSERSRIVPSPGRRSRDAARERPFEVDREAERAEQPAARRDPADRSVGRPDADASGRNVDLFA